MSSRSKRINFRYSNMRRQPTLVHYPRRCNQNPICLSIDYEEKYEFICYCGLGWYENGYTCRLTVLQSGAILLAGRSCIRASNT
eukprot:5920254-Amphidinium_carterae.1